MRYLALLPALLAPAGAHAQSEDLLGKYASAKIYCIDDKKLVFEIARGVITARTSTASLVIRAPPALGLRSTIPNARLGMRCGSRPSLSTSLTRQTMSG